jgi:iron complex transport system permease protein
MNKAPDMMNQARDVGAGSPDAEALDIFSTRRFARRIALLALALAAAAVVSFLLGRYFAAPGKVAEAIVEQLWYGGTSDPKLAAALFNIRLPRIAVVTLVGMALSLAGASYQGMFRNPLVSPDLLGASAGASFGACLAMLLNLGNESIQLFAFFTGLAAVGLVMLVNKAVRGDALLGLILGGILIGSLFSSGTSIIKLVADADDKLPAITFWLMGSFAGVTRSDVLPLLIPMAAGFLLVLTQGWNLNVLSFGEDEARTLGVNTGLTRTLVIIGATLLTASSIAVAGVIGWIGLMAPHLTRALVGPNYRTLLPTTMLTGAIFLLVVDNFARLTYSVEIPIGLLTSILGVPFFVFIYRRNLRGW